MKNILSFAMIALSMTSAPAFAAVPTAEITIQKLERNHVEFIFARHLGVDVAHAKRAIGSTSAGAPVSLFFDLDGVSAFFTTQDGTTIHTLVKAHRTFLHLPEGVELNFSISVGGSDVMNVERIYGVREFPTLVNDLKTISKNLQDKEWRETTATLTKMLICAQLTQLEAKKGLVPNVVSRALKGFKASCAQ